MMKKHSTINSLHRGELFSMHIMKRQVENVVVGVNQIV
ncbi:hypothetical protein B4064_3567 [Caldibacillus thermoamylovorans]|nr:hypothetical protein B4064_3567 [Caldibacillus thermoamylovorans]